MRRLIIILALVVSMSAAAGAQDHSGHHAHEKKGKIAPVDIYAPAMEKMHKDMVVTPTGDPDIDFIKGMIPHHQGAVDMARIVLEKGKDPEVRKLAEDVIASQEKEIKFMQQWLKKQEGEGE